MQPIFTVAAHHLMRVPESQSRTNWKTLKGFLTKSDYTTKIKNSGRLYANNSYTMPNGAKSKEIKLNKIFWFKVEG